MQKDRERCEKMGKDSGCIVEHGFSCDAANVHMCSLTAVSYTYGGSRSLRGVFSPTRLGRFLQWRNTVFFVRIYPALDGYLCRFLTIINEDFEVA